MKARIYSPARNAMQSGEAKSRHWQLVFEPEKKTYVEPLMGWTASSDMRQQLKLRFPTKEEAIAYAIRNNIPFEIQLPKPRKKIKKSYADNFAYKPV